MRLCCAALHLRAKQKKASIDHREVNGKTLDKQRSARGVAANVFPKQLANAVTRREPVGHTTHLVGGDRHRKTKLLRWQTHALRTRTFARPSVSLHYRRQAAPRAPASAAGI